MRKQKPEADKNQENEATDGRKKYRIFCKNIMHKSLNIP